MSIYEIGALLPWRISVLLALSVYLSLHMYAESDPVIVTDPKHALDTLVPSIGRQVARFAQYAVPSFLLAGALASLLGQARRSRLLASVVKGGSTAGWASFHGASSRTWYTSCSEDRAIPSFRHSRDWTVEGVLGLQSVSYLPRYPSVRTLIWRISRCTNCAPVCVVARTQIRPSA